MIIQSLIEYYNILEKEGLVPRPGWVVQKIHYAIDLDIGGNLKGIRSVKQIIEKEAKPVVKKNGKKEEGKPKTIELPQQISLPFSGPRSRQVKANFLWEKASYVFALADEKTDKKRCLECFSAFRELAHTIMDPLSTNEIALAVLSFLDNWDPMKAEDNPVFERIDDINASNFIFCVNGAGAHTDKQIGNAWDAYYEASNESTNLAVSVVSGKKAPVCLVHPKVTGISGEKALSSGMSLVSFNIGSACSEGKKQGENAPMSEYEAFAYTTALRYMIQQRQVYKVGDVTTFFWSKSANLEMQKLISDLFYNTMFQKAEPEAVQCIEDLAAGYPGVYKEHKIDPSEGFCLLGIRPNSARLTIQFFIEDSFGRYAKNIDKYFEDINIFSTSKYYENVDFSVFTLMDATRRFNASEAIRPDFLKAMIDSVLNDRPFPSSALIAIMARIQKEKTIRPQQAAFLKGYLMRRRSQSFPKEVLQVALNTETNDSPYLLGRLFFILEQLQKTAIPEVQVSVRVRFMSQTSLNPAQTMPTMLRLSQAHITKLLKNKEKRGLGKMYDDQITDLINRIEQPYPKHLDLEEQARFYLGYYHQREYQFTPKKKSENAEENK